YVREVRFDVAVSSGAPNEERVAVLEVRRCSSFAAGRVIIRRRKPDTYDPRRYFKSRDRSRSRREPANITSAFRSTSQHIAPNTSPVSLDAPILRRGSRLRERATMPNGANLGYTCVNDLVKQARVNCVGKKPRSMYQRLSTMRQKSEMVKKNGNDKTAYILLKRWLDTINEVKTILADLRQKSEIRYEHSSRKHNDAVEKMEVDTDGVDTAKTYAPSSDVSLKLPETPTDDPLYGDSDNFISCNQLYSLSQTNNSRYLIIDVRQKAHYDGSKITFDKCINIPQSEIKPGMNAITYFGKLETSVVQGGSVIVGVYVEAKEKIGRREVMASRRAAGTIGKGRLGKSGSSGDEKQKRLKWSSEDTKEEDKDKGKG
ncbi:hypothetical protein X777_09482, partial [Ooceraea biroi]